MCIQLRSPDADLSAWNAHADRLTVLGRMLTSIAADGSCECGDCEHCLRLAWLEVEIKSARAEAIAVCNELSAFGAYLKPPQVGGGIGS